MSENSNLIPAKKGDVTTPKSGKKRGRKPGQKNYITTYLDLCGANKDRILETHSSLGITQVMVDLTAAEIIQECMVVLYAKGELEKSAVWAERLLPYQMKKQAPEYDPNTTITDANTLSDEVLLALIDRGQMAKRLRESNSIDGEIITQNPSKIAGK